MGLARQIAERIVAKRYEELPPQAVYWSKVAFLDTLGVMLAGAVEEAPRLAARALAAHTAGFETGTRIGRGVNFHHYEKGWHPTSTLGTFAVAAACANLLRLTADKTATALAVAASLAAEIKANFGTMTKPLHVGHCARNGLFAVLLAREGYTASGEAFEHKQGFFNVYNGAGNYRAERILEKWADPLDIVEPGAGYKQYPCCAGTHAAVDAACELTRRHGRFDPARIALVETWTPARRLAHTDRPEPRSNLDAKFSVQYCVARALTAGAVVLEHFEGESYRDPQMTDLMRRTRSAPHQPGQFAPDNRLGAEVKVTLVDGTGFSGKVELALGRTSRNPIPLERLRAKFENCAIRMLARERAEHVARQIDGLERMSSVRELTALLEPVVDGRGEGAARSAA
ncbi:MAG: MmgE/PrpD family protein [Betaproteobacteria bacterium]|nr:MmgE/PrpD family protein [Betaproteobacteria bacterium]